MITPAESEAGLKAYEQTLAFAALRRKKLPWVYALFPVLLLVTGAVALRAGVGTLGAICPGSAVLFAVYARWNWRRLCALDTANRARLAQLHAQYGDELPWLQVERQTESIRQIQAEQERSVPPPET